MSLIKKLDILRNTIERVPVLQWCIGMCAGAIISEVRWCVGGIVLSLLLVIVRKRRYIALLCGIAAMTIRIALIPSGLPADHISALNGSTVRIRASVSSDSVEKEEKTNVVMDVRELCVAEDDVGTCEQWEPRSGKIQMWFERYRKARLGDIWEIVGKIEEPQDTGEDFSYSSYLAQKDVYSVLYRGNFTSTGTRLGYSPSLFFWDVGNVLRLKISRSLPEPHASLLSGMLFGFRSGQFEEFMSDLQRTGVTHVIAASGYNVSVVSAGISSLTKRFNRRVRTIISIAGIWCFSLLSGGSVPVLRAAIMSMYSGFGLLLGCRGSVHVGLWLSMSLFLLCDPETVSDVSFQLSYASTAGLVYLSPVIDRFVPNSWSSVRENGSITISAIIATLPLSLVHFGSFSSVALAVNMLVLPLVTPAMAIGGVLVVVPSFLNIVRTGVSIAAWVPLDIFIKVSHYFAALPFASITTGKITWMTVAFVYVVLFFMIVLLSSSGNSLKREVL